MSLLKLLKSMIQQRCPRCRKSTIFKHRIGIYPSKNLVMKERCAHCQLNYMMEPSFYFGAMYIAYALSVVIALVLFLGSWYFIFKKEILYNLMVVFTGLILTSPFNLRMARSVWIHLFVKYRG